MILEGSNELMLLVSFLNAKIQYNSYQLVLPLPKQKNMFDKASCHENYPQYSYFPSLNLYLPPEGQFFQHVLEIHQHFEKEMTGMKQEVSKLTKTVGELKTMVDQCRRSKKKNKALKTKKFYKKDKACQYEGCEKKYSSQIALNAHIKKVHRKKEEDSSEYVL